MKIFLIIVLIASLVSGCASQYNGTGQRRFNEADDLQLYGREFGGQTVELVGDLTFVKGMYLLNIGGDVLLLPSQQLKPTIGQYVGKRVVVIGVLEYPQDKGPDPVVDSSSVNLAQGWGGYTLFRVQVDSIRRK
jgi:membrane protein implicated in regulation of membrane protease activity